MVQDNAIPTNIREQQQTSILYFKYYYTLYCIYDDTLLIFSLYYIPTIICVSRTRRR